MIATLRKLAALDGARCALAFEAAAMLALSRLWLGVRPFREIARRLGRAGTPESVEPDRLEGPSLQSARAVRWAIDRAAARVPFEAACLPRAVAAKLMLSRRGIPARVRFGVARNADFEAGSDALRAHAWVSAGQVRVSGYPVDSELVVVAQFD